MKVPLSDFEGKMEVCFTLHPGKNECERANVFPIFLSMPNLNNYIWMICFQFDVD